MAKTRIEKDDIASKDIFKNIIDGALEAEKKVQALESSLKLIKDISKNIRNSSGGIKANTNSVKDIESLNAMAKQSNILAENRLKIDNALMVEKKRLATIQADQNKIIKTEVESTMKLTKEQQNELGTLQKLEIENRQLRAERAKLNLETKEGTARMKEINAQLDINNKKIKDSGDEMKRQKLNVGNYNGAVNKLRNGLAQLGLGFGVFQLLKGAGTTIMEFDSAVADLKSITGLKEGTKDLNMLKDSAIDLGKTVQGGAKEVIEAYKLIGSAKPELLENADALNQVTKSAILLSQASGMELPASATALTDAMNQFGASADQADKFVNVLANGAKFGAVEIPQVTEALLKFGAVAKTSNVSIEESTALIEALGEKGQKGAEAGTALRNVMLKISAPDALPKEAQDRLKALGVSFDDLTDKSKPFSERLKALKPLLKDEASLVKVFGMENVVTAKNLLGSSERIAELNKQMKVNGTATEQANERNKTLSFAINKVKESFNGYVLKMSEGVNASSGLTWIMTKLADNFEDVTKVLFTLIRVFGYYKLAMLSLKMKDRIDEWVKYRKSIKDSGEALNEGQNGAKKFGNALKGIGFAVAIELAVMLASKLWDIASGAEQARENMERFDKTVNRALDKANDYLEKRAKINEKYTNELERQRKVELSKAKSDKERFEINQKYDAMQVEFGKKNTKQLENELKNMTKRKALMQEDLDMLKKQQAIVDKSDLQTQKGFAEFRKLEKMAKEIGEKYKIKGDEYYFGLGVSDLNAPDAIAQLKANIGAIYEKQKLWKGAIDESTEALKDQNTDIIANTNENKKNTIETEKSTKAHKKRAKQLFDENEFFKMLNDSEREHSLLLNEIKEYDVTEAINSEMELQKKQGTMNIELLDELLKKEKEIQEEKARIQYEYELENAKNNQDRQNAEERLKFELIKIDDEYNKNRKAKIKELEDAQEEHANKEVDKVEEVTQKTRKSYMNILSEVTDFFIKQADKRIAKIQEEIDAHQKQSDVLKELAMQGNINAQQSIAEEEKLKAEAIARKEKEEKRKQQLLMLTAILQAYSANLENGDDSVTALTKAITSKGIIEQIVSSLPAFYEGTEDTGTVARPLDANGGRPAIIHDNERILTKKQNQKIGNFSNEFVAETMEKVRLGKMVGATQIIGGFGSELVVNELMNVSKKLDNVAEIIKNKPETSFEFAEIIGNTMKLIKKTTEGRNKTVNTYITRS